MSKIDSIRLPVSFEVAFMRKLMNLETSTSLYALPLRGGDYDAPILALQEIIETAAQILPNDGPVGSFTFLNALHALEHHPFDQAIREGSRLFGCEPYWTEDRYRLEMARGRIRSLDLRAVLDEDRTEAGWCDVAGLCSRQTLRETMLKHSVRCVPDEELAWCLEEFHVLSRFRDETPSNVRKEILADTLRWVVRDQVSVLDDNGFAVPAVGDARRNHVLWPLLERFGVDGIDHWSDDTWQAFALEALWAVCDNGVAKLKASQVRSSVGVRPRNLMLEATQTDSDLLVHEALIKFCAAFTDQGFAAQPLPFREKGFFRSFCKLYRGRFGPPTAWMRGLAKECARLDDDITDPLDSIAESLKVLGIREEEWHEFLPATLLALRGWASMIRQMEVRPDRVAVPVPVGTLTEFLAVRLLLERFAIAHVAKEKLGYTGPLSGVRDLAQSKIVKAKRPSKCQRTYLVFQLAQLMGWTPSVLNALSEADWTQLVTEIEAFGSVERRRVFHKAYERRVRVRSLDAISLHSEKTAGPTPGAVTPPKFQAFFCIDAREESFRRHIEEVEPKVATYGAPGFFGVAIYYRGAGDAHFAALCPIVVKPQHWVVEEVVTPLEQTHRRRKTARKAIGSASHQLHRGSLGIAGSLLTAGLGVLATMPLAARVLFPRATARLRKSADDFLAPPAITRLSIERFEGAPGPDGDNVGFTVPEMADRAERLLRDVGLTSNFSRLVFFLGHAAHCLNNPHKSAYDCGACTGPGGPNARALAMMLNDPRVRDILAERGLPIPRETLFLGGYHNTTTDAVTCYDLDLLPKSHHKDYAAAIEIFEKACERNAHERCRRFDSAPLNLPLPDAHRHVERRSEDLAQVRPEFGNATNALCFVGRRERIRGLFLDRRCFQHSYDPFQDDANHSKLARILAPVVPVCQGINLTYFFSAIDNNAWGASTKLPHNVTALLGVMDGAASDLRTGLPWQSVEIHEPVRLLFVIESTADAMHKIMNDNPIVGRILKNGWAQLALLSPTSNEIHVYHNGEFQPYQPEAAALPRAGASIDWYRGRRDHLDFAVIDA